MENLDDKNFNIDEQIEKIKGQMETEETVLEPGAEASAQEMPQQAWQDPFGEITENDAVKKYVIYISKDFVPVIDNMDTDARSAYVNEAIQHKLDCERENQKIHIRHKIITHVFLIIMTIIIGVPSMFFLINKSIDLTVDNYRYVQQNFEKLYKQHAEKQRIINRAKMNIGRDIAPR